MADPLRLARLGFLDSERTLRELPPGWPDDPRWARLVAAAGRSAAPDAAIARLMTLQVADAALSHPDQAGPFLAALGFSEHLLALCLRTPGLAQELAGGPPGGYATLRARRDARFARIVVDDLSQLPTRESFEKAGRSLSDLADACLEEVLDGASGFAVMAMGKYGGRELNYASDIDVLFVSEDKDAESLARSVMETMNGPPTIFRTDADLRPQGIDGPLVRTLGAYRAYYQRWARVWEFQSLIKCRFAAGDPDVGRAFLELVAPFVWPSALAPESIEQVRTLKARAEEVVSRRGESDRQVKLGPGGIRDVEFAVQLLQLVHGRLNPALRSPNTLEALDALGAQGYVAEKDAAELAAAYVHLRHTEHRLQLVAGRQTHTLPGKPAEREHLARGLGYRDSPGSSALDAFEADWRKTTAAVRRIHERLFYRPLLEVFGAAQSVSHDWLAAIGFDRPPAAIEAIGDLQSGRGRSSKVMRVVAPAMLQWLAETPDPDAGLTRLSRLVPALEAVPHLLAQLRDNPPLAERLCRVLGTGPVLAASLERDPGLVAALASEPGPDRDAYRAEALAVASRGGVRSLRRFKDAEWLAIAAADLGAGPALFVELARRLSHLADACLEAALVLAGAPSQGFAVVGMGRLGGEELSSASDLDVMFVYDDGDEARRLELSEVAERVMGVLNAVPPIFKVDAQIRPEGRSGPLVRSLASYVHYYERWAAVWEYQALLRARHAAGDATLTARLLDRVGGFSCPESLTDAQLEEIRHIKARIERERLGVREDPRYQLKTGTGGLVDVEFSVQLLQMRCGYAHPKVRDANTLRAIDALESEGDLCAQDARWLREAYLMIGRLRNHLFLLRGVVSDVLPGSDDELERLARSLGYGRGGRSALLEEYRRKTRRARQVCDRVFYGEGP